MVKKFCSRNRNDFSTEGLAEKMREGSHVSDGVVSEVYQSVFHQHHKIPKRVNLCGRNARFFTYASGVCRLWLMALLHLDCSAAEYHGEVTGKESCLRSWRTGSEVTSTGCFSRGPEFSS